MFRTSLAILAAGVLLGLMFLGATGKIEPAAMATLSLAGLTGLYIAAARPAITQRRT